jgi:coenzyme PQQ precursor peptide PqqA
MAQGLGRSPTRRQHRARDSIGPPRRPAGRRDVPAQGDFRMQWQTPTATDLRFGFEITLYVAAR